MRVLDDPAARRGYCSIKVVWTGVLGVYAFGRCVRARLLGGIGRRRASVCAAPKRH